MNTLVTKAFLCTCLSLTPFSLSAAADKTAPQRIGELVQEFAEKEAAGGVAVAVLYGDGAEGEKYRREVYSGGHTKGPNSPHPNERTTFYLASVTKVFTATVLAKFVKEGKVGLDDPAQKYVPQWVHVPKYDGAQITLEELATHTSGLQRDAGGVKRPFHYQVNEFYNFLNHASLKYKPGTRNIYSNVGFGFLGLILGNIAGHSYEEVILQNLCEPLGMPNTRIHFNQEMQDNRPEFFDRRGKLVKASCCATLPALGGGGAFASNIDDMSRFLAYNMGLLNTDLDDLLPMLQEHRFTLKPNNFQCLGWYNNPLYNDNSAMVFSKNGGMDGVSSYIAFVQETKTGVVVLANCNSDTVALGREILKILNPKKM